MPVAITNTALVTAISDNTGIFIGTVASGGRTDDRSLALIGSLAQALTSGQSVRVYDGAAYLGLAKVTGTGWTFSDARTLKDGQLVSYTAKVSDASGNLGDAGTA